MLARNEYFVSIFSHATPIRARSDVRSDRRMRQVNVGGDLPVSI